MPSREIVTHRFSDTVHPIIGVLYQTHGYYIRRPWWRRAAQRGNQRATEQWFTAANKSLTKLLTTLQKSFVDDPTRWQSFKDQLNFPENRLFVAHQIFLDLDHSAQVSKCQIPEETVQQLGQTLLVSARLTLRKSSTPEVDARAAGIWGDFYTSILTSQNNAFALQALGLYRHLPERAQQIVYDKCLNIPNNSDLLEKLQKIAFQSKIDRIFER